MRWKNIEVISWDVDGTLYSMRRVVLWLTALAAKRLAWPGPRPTLRELRELKRHQLRMAAVRRRGGQITDEDRAFRTTGLEALEKRWYVRAIGLAGPRGGVAETIATLSQLGLRQVVVSDYDADHKLECLCASICGN